MMSPAVKYTLGRIGLFLLVTVLLLFTTPLNPFVDAMIGFVVSFALHYFVLADWRNQLAEHQAAPAPRGDAALPEPAPAGKARAALTEPARAATAGAETTEAADASAPPGATEEPLKRD